MPFAITLPLDDEAASHVRRMWNALAEQTGVDDVLRIKYTPHITLAILSDAARISDLEDVAFRVMSRWVAQSIIFAGLGIFPGTPSVIWVAPVVTFDLLALHAELYKALVGFDVLPYYRPNCWVPHVTLTKEASEPAARLIGSISSAWSGPTSARLERVELVQFRPVKVLRRRSLPKNG